MSSQKGHPVVAEMIDKRLGENILHAQHLRRIDPARGDIYRLADHREVEAIAGAHIAIENAAQMGAHSVAKWRVACRRACLVEFPEPTFGPECRFIGAFPTLRQGVPKVAV